MLPNPQPYFENLPDPRRGTKNKLHDIVMITLCAQLSGVEDGVGMEVFAQEREGWLRGFLELPNGIPSHDTLSEVMGRLNPTAFREDFMKWVEVALPSLAGEPMAVDGKTRRGSGGAEGPVHLMSAFASQAWWVLGQVPVSGKANEITAIPPLLALLDLSGATVTIDAAGCQKKIAGQIIEGRGDDVLALKGNHPPLYEEVSLWLDSELDAGHLQTRETVEKDHARLERRR